MVAGGEGRRTMSRSPRAATTGRASRSSTSPSAPGSSRNTRTSSSSVRAGTRTALASCTAGTHTFSPWRSQPFRSCRAVVRGRAVGVVVATGMDTEIGRIASLLGRSPEEPTPLQEQITWLGKALGIVVVVLAAIVVVAILLTSDVSSFADVVDALLVGVSLAVAAVPEGLPAILTVVLALGVQRMARERAIVKKLSSVETLGSASVICTDKTGTLTRGKPEIRNVFVEDGWSVDEALARAAGLEAASGHPLATRESPRAASRRDDRVALRQPPTLFNRTWLAPQPIPSA